MLFRCLVLLFCLTAISAQKGGRIASASEEKPFQRSPSRALAGRKIPQPSEPIEQVQAPEEPDRDPEEDREVVLAARPQRPRPQLPPPPPPRQQPTEVEGHEPAPEPYSFSYSVDDPETGAATSRQETQDINGEVVGFYHIKDAEGRTRRVDYTAGKDGFKATIKSNEEGLNARAPADVNIEVSASPSETRPVYTPNNRPDASESSIKSFGVRPPSERVYQRLAYAPLPAPLPVPSPSAPLPVPSHESAATVPRDPVESQRIEQIVQKSEDPPEETAQISQKYEDPPQQTEQISQKYEELPSEPIVQQQNVDVEEAFESAPPQPLAPVKGVSPIPPPPTRPPINYFNPQRFQTFSGETPFNFQPIASPTTSFNRVKQEISNTIEEPITSDTKETPNPPAVVAPPPTYPSLSSIFSSFPLTRPTPYLTPILSQFQQRGQTVGTVRQTPINNIVLQQVEHKQPISQEKLLNYFQPLSTGPFGQSSQEVVIAPPATRHLQLDLPLQQYQPLTQQKLQPITSGYRLSLQHRENHLQTQPLQLQTLQLVPPPPQPKPLPQVNLPLIPYQYRPLPQKPVDSFETQRYEPLRQTYEPFQQQVDTPPCDCARHSQTIAAPVKSTPPQESSEPQTVNRLSPVRAFIPQAFRT